MRLPIVTLPILVLVCLVATLGCELPALEEAQRQVQEVEQEQMAAQPSAVSEPEMTGNTDGPATDKLSVPPKPLPTPFGSAGFKTNAQQARQHLGELVGQVDVSEGMKEKARDHHRRGLDPFRGRRYKEAIEHFDMAISADPTYAEAYTFRGLAYSALSQHEKALADHAEAVSLAPDSAEAHSHYGKACSCSAIPSSLTVKRKCPHHGACDIDAARAGKASGTQ